MTRVIATDDAVVDPPDAGALADAHALHRAHCVIDLHADTAKLMRRFDYDLHVAHEPLLPGAANLLGHVDVPRLRAGGVTAQFFSYWTWPVPERGCAADVDAQISALDAAMRPDTLNWTLSADAVVAAHAHGSLGAIGGIEGGQALEGDPGRVAHFATRGVRYLGLLHFSANALGAPAKGRGADPDRGLTALGIDVVRECERHGVLVDLAHINRRGFFDALAHTKTPPLVSHTGVAGVHPHWRNIDDAQIRAVAERQGVIGVIFARRYLGGATLDDVARHLEHLVNIGGDECIALGSDFDGFVVPPIGLADVSQLPHLTACLLSRGWSAARIAKVLGENVLRVLRAVPPRSDRAG